MTPHDLEAMRRAQRRDLALLAAAVIGLFFAVRATMPEPLPVQTGPGHETCTTTGC